MIRAIEPDREALELLELARQHDTSGGLVSVAEVIQGATMFEALIDGRRVLVYGLKVIEHELGREGVIVAAAGRAGSRDLTAEVLPIIERQFIDCASVLVHTRRAGLAAKLERQGYTNQGAILRKKLDHATH